MSPTGLTKAERDRRLAQGQRVARLRISKTGLSPEAFGATIGVNGSTIRNIEAGRGPRRPHVRTMFAIARGLEEEVFDLFPPERQRTRELVPA